MTTLKRMSKERMGEIEAYENRLCIRDHADELLQALKADREYVEAMEATLESANECHDAIQNDAIKDIEELTAWQETIRQWCPEVAGIADEEQMAILDKGKGDG